MRAGEHCASLTKTRAGGGCDRHKQSPERVANDAASAADANEATRPNRRSGFSRESFRVNRRNPGSFISVSRGHGRMPSRSGLCLGRLKPLLQGNGTIHGYLLLMYFSRRIAGTGRPWPFRVSKHTSTMFGLPQR